MKAHVPCFFEILAIFQVLHQGRCAYMNLFKKYRIGSLLFGSFAALITILLVIVTLISYHFSVNEIVDNTTFYQQEMLNVLNKELSSQMRSIEEASLAISRNH